MQIITKYFSNLTEIQLEQFEKLGALYHDLNNKINVISRKDIENLYERHVLHSLAIAKFITFKKGSSIMDVGCGGGFPGIPLAILFPEVHFHMVDSIAKKLTVVQSVAEGIGLSNVTVEHTRVEKVKKKFDFIVSRAVTAFPKFISLTQSKIANGSKNSIPNGIIYLKGGDFEEEVKQVRKVVEVVDISTYFEEEFFETKKIIYLPQ